MAGKKEDKYEVRRNAAESKKLERKKEGREIRKKARKDRKKRKD